MLWRVEIKNKESVFDAMGEGLRRDILDLGIRTLEKVEVVSVYTLQGEVTAAEIKKICEELLVNKITQDFRYSADTILFQPQSEDVKVIEIAYHAGVMDPVEDSTIKGIRDLGIQAIQAVRTSKKYILHGHLTDKDLETVVNKVLANKLIQHVVTETDLKPLESPDDLKKVDVRLVDLIKASNKELLRISRRGQLFLNLREMRAIQKYFRKVGRNPTDCELETIAQTWSEHCYHKTFRGDIRYQYHDGKKKKKKLIRNLLKSTIAKVTYTLKKPWCVSVFHDNAGVIKFDDEHHVCFKVETHNHPSALEPFGGANTGVGGVIRDILGTGLGGKPICSTDVFCFAPPGFPFEDLPAGVLHPKRIMKGVVSGVRDYGNKMGIPTVNGAIVFDRHFVGNPLVYCGNVGLIPKDKVKKSVHKGDLIVVVGGRTGRDGIHGATFSSGELTKESEVISSGAVQIGNPIQEKKMMDVLLQARDQGLYCAITDCGAGGFSSAVGEMGKDLGVRVDLEKVPLKYHGLNYTEIWISESQERMAMAVPPQKINQFLAVCESENVEATVIGEFTGTKRLELFYSDCQVCDLSMKFLHGGLPKTIQEAVWVPPKIEKEGLPQEVDLNQKLKEVLSHYNVCSKEWVIRQYDHEVQGSTILKPLVGVHNDGPSDAAVLAPKLGSKKGVAVANGINVRFGLIDPFWMAASCIDEAVRQIIAVGGDVNRIAILDNFCWGNPDKRDRLGSLVRAAEGCFKTALGYGVPFISGKDSLNNEYTENKKSLAISGTILISSIGIIDDVTKCVSMDFKEAGNLIYIVGMTFEELGGSIYLDTYGQLGQSVPHVNTKEGKRIFQSLTKAVEQGLIRAMHDCSEGGLGVALAEMAFSGELGTKVSLDTVPYEGKSQRNDIILFSESNSRFIVEINGENQAQFEKLLKEIPFGLIGRVQENPQFIVLGLNQEECLNLSLLELKEAWQKPLRW